MSESRSPGHIPLHLSMDDPEPMYRQIESQLRDFILSGQLPAGTKLPSVRSLASELACSVITTRRAYQDLEAAGFIRTRHGIGTIVAELDRTTMEEERRIPIQEAFHSAVEAGNRAGLPADELRAMFEDALRRRGTQTEED
jgi:GntR family transcriptional regulator